MKSITRKIVGAALVLGACAFASPAQGQATSKKAEKHAASKKAKANKVDPVAVEAARRAHVRLHELCQDGVWSIHVSNPCIRHEDKVARQNRAATKARDRAVLSAARRNRGVVATVSSESGAH